MASINLIPRKTYNDVRFFASDNEFVYALSDNTISFPYRIYFKEIEDEIIKNLNDTEKMILHCIYSRSCNGYVREKHIRALLSMDFPEWAIPYIVKICDEYIVEILQMTYNNLKNKNTDAIKSFCIRNWASFCKSYNRMISYWNEFYRNDCYKFEDYIGRKLFIECFGAKRTMNCAK